MIKITYFVPNRTGNRMMGLGRSSIWRSRTRQQNKQNSKTHKWQGLQPKVIFYEDRLDKINTALTCQECLVVLNKRLKPLIILELALANN